MVSTMILLIAFFSVFFGGRAIAQDQAITSVVSDDPYRTEVYTVPAGSTLLEILQTQGGVPYEQALTVIEKINEIHDVTKIQSGEDISFVYDKSTEALSSAAYDISDTEFLRIVLNGYEVQVTQEEIIYRREEVSKEGTINESLYQDGIAAGLTDRMILELASVFAWDVDFTSSIQTGDRFVIVYENLYRDEVFAGTGDIIAASFMNEGNVFYAYRTIDDQGNRHYFNEQGESKKRLFLKTPLNYRRISSGFTNSRKHPVLGDFRSHRALDLAADTGTPVETVGDGTVTSAGYSGALGNYIRIKHGQGFETGYAHLSKIYVKKGQTVTQGDVIGAVGSTGRSTGPHLHYEMFKNGSYVNAFTIQIPKGQPIDEIYKPQLDTMVATYKATVEL